MSIRILLVEDEPNIRGPLEKYLGAEGFSVVSAASVAEAARLADAERPDLVLLDWMLPDGQGIEWLRSLRARGFAAPVIFLTARSDLVDKVLGLELGANDYLTKPFEPRELVARIRVQLRARQAPVPAAAPGPARGPAAPLEVDPVAREVRFRGAPVALKKTEFELLRHFHENPNQVFSREELLKAVWGYGSAPTTRTVDTHVLQLRQKLAPEMFETVHGVGYRYRPPAA